MNKSKELYCICCGRKLSNSPVEISVGQTTFCSQKCYDEYYKIVLKPKSEDKQLELFDDL